jgi:hypothetical protein
MSLRDAYVVSLAALFGFLGGAVTQRHAAEAASSEVVRATRLELVDETGKRLAFWGRDVRGNLVIGFEVAGSGEVAVLGLDSGKHPFLTLSGSDGRAHADLRLGSGERPFLSLGHERCRRRVKLGYVGYDAPSPEDDRWGLVFDAPRGHRSVAAIGYSRNLLDGKLNGSVFVEDSKGKTWRAP